MKALRLIALTAMCMAGSYALAQDLIVTNDGKSMTVYNMEVSSESVFYQLEDKKDATVQKIAKSDILIVKKADGTKLDFASLPTSNAAEDKQKEINSPKVTPSISPEEVKRINKDFIDDYNGDITIKVDEKVKNERAKELWARFGMNENSVLTDGIVTMNVHMGALRKESKKSDAHFVFSDSPFYDPSILISLYNGSDNTVYVDLSNCFYIFLGNSSSYYTPTSTTTNNASSAGVGVNLGSIANAIGIGGTVGTLANGINVGKNSSNGVSHTTYAQRIIAIPPKSSYDMAPRYLFGEVGYPYTGLRYRNLSGYSYINVFDFSFPKKVKKGALVTGERLMYSEEKSPLTFSAIVSYSFTEDCSDLHKMSANMYLKDIVGLYHSFWSSDKVEVKMAEKSRLVGIKAYSDDWSSTSFPKQ